MDVQINERYPLYCDTGRHEGMHRIDLRGSVYLTDEELVSYQSVDGGLVIALKGTGNPGPGTAEEAGNGPAS